MRTVRIIQKFAAPLCVAAALVLSPVAAFAQEIVTINIQSILMIPLLQNPPKARLTASVTNTRTS